MEQRMKQTKDIAWQVKYNTQRDLLKATKDTLNEKTLRNLEKDDSYFERNFLIGIITDNEFCLWAKDSFNTKYLQSSTARVITNWIYEYAKEFDKAPGQDIESIYYDKLKSGNIQEELAEEIEVDILPKLSEDFENRGIDIRYLKQRTEKYLNIQIAAKRIEEAQSHLEKHDLDELNIVLNIEPPQAETINMYIHSIAEMEAMGVKKPRLLLKPWLREGETNILYSEAGVGKSLLAILIAYLLGLKRYDSSDAEIAGWQVKNPTGTLYIDGELGEPEMIERVKQFSWLGEQQEGKEIKTLSIPSYQITTGKDMNLSNRKNQRKIIEWLKKNPDYKFLILDSVSTTFELESENDNSEWNKKINPFLKNLRALGVAHLIQHHEGKDGKLRGASAMNAMAHNQFRLQNHKEKEQGQAWFLVNNSGKQRAAGDLMKPFYIKFITDGEKTFWEISDFKYNDEKSDKKNTILCELMRGTKPKVIMEQVGVGASYISQVKKSAIDMKLMDSNGNITKNGVEFLEDYGEVYKSKDTV